MKTLSKDPDAVLDYTLDWTTWLSSGETMTDVEVTISGADDSLVVADDKPAPSPGQFVVIWLAGGTAGRRYIVTCHATTSAAREEDFSFQLWVRQM